MRGGGLGERRVGGGCVGFGFGEVVRDVGVGFDEFEGDRFGDDVAEELEVVDVGDGGGKITVLNVSTRFAFRLDNIVA